MGGAVSAGRDNNELIDNLMSGKYIRTREVERVFRALDRAEYMTPEARDQAYKDLAWRQGPLHLSAPCIYSEVMEGLELKPCLSFLNIGSGTGYLSTMVGLILGSGGISHGVEINSVVVEYAVKKMSQFLENSPTLDEFDFCEPKFYCGNGLRLAPLQCPYDRVYCGAGCPEEYQNYLKQLIKVGGILVMPLNDNLLQVRRVAVDKWNTRNLLNVSFATLRKPGELAEDSANLIKLEEQTPPRLQLLARAAIREAMRRGVCRRHPELREPPPRHPPAKKACPRRICIPIDDDDDVEGLNELHDLDREGGANEMNALLSLVLRMGQNRVAGALRFDHVSSSSSSDTNSDDDRHDGDDNDGADDANDAAVVADESADRNHDRDRDRDRDRIRRRDRNRNRNRDSDRESDRVPYGVTYELPSVAEMVHQALDMGNEENDRPDGQRNHGLRPCHVLTFQLRDSGETSALNTLDSSDSSIDSSKFSNDTSIGEATKSIDEPTEPSTKSTNESKKSADGGEALSAENSTGFAKSTDNIENVPAEVEVCLNKTNGSENVARAKMETSTNAFEKQCAGDAPEKRGSSDDETTEEVSSKGKEKRQKLDSGLGEENTPSSGTSPAAIESKSDESDFGLGWPRPPDSPRDDADSAMEGRRRQKRSRYKQSVYSSSSSTEGSGGEGGGGAGGSRRRHKRRAGDGGDARRVRLSLLMKRAVKELPLPHALKKYVNLGRCFQI